MFKDYNKDIRARSRRRSNVLVANSEHISFFFLVLLFLNLSWQILAVRLIITNWIFEFKTPYRMINLLQFCNNVIKSKETYQFKDDETNRVEVVTEMKKCFRLKDMFDFNVLWNF